MSTPNDIAAFAGGFLDSYSGAGDYYKPAVTDAGTTTPPATTAAASGGINAQSVILLAVLGLAGLAAYKYFSKKKRG